LLNLPASQEPSRLVTASQSRADVYSSRNSLRHAIQRKTVPLLGIRASLQIVRSRRKPTLVGLKGKSEDQPHAKQIAPAEGVTPPAEVRVSFLTTPLSTRGGAFRSSSDPGEGTRAPGASWASRAATTRIGPGFAMSSATRTASFPQCAVVSF
jgi:hypothetical protein